jgi:O-antigen/teichoic acid export membrane protein
MNGNSTAEGNPAASRPGDDVSLGRLLAFFVPLGISASLVSLSHVIINGTLARSAHPEATIAAYTIAFSLFVITERPAVYLRQTCSTLAGDRTAFKAVGKVVLYYLLAMLAFGLLISYTPAGTWLFRSLFNAAGATLAGAVDSYRVLIFVTLFSATRCLFHGIIIRNMQTKWMTVGMVVRLAFMYGLSLVFLHAGLPIEGWTGAVIFLVGMMVEAAVSIWEGKSIYRRMPDQLPDSTIRTARDVFPFYRPLVVTALFSVVLGPMINVMLGKTASIELAIASFAVAQSVTNIVTSFYSYMHQIVLNFHHRNAGAVRKFAVTFNFVPALLIAAAAFTPLGRLLVGAVVGGEGALLDESLRVLKVFVLLALAFPWVDYANGLAMLHRNTRFMMASQFGNVLTAFVVLLAAVVATPGWNGTIGALGQSCGVLAELAVIWLLIFRLRRRRPGRP